MRVDQVGDQRGERVVLAERAAAQLVVGDHIVLVDDRHDAEAQQPQQRVAHVEVADPLGHVNARDQRLRGGQVVALEQLVVALDQVGLADRRQRLALADARAVGARADPRAAGRHCAAGDHGDLDRGAAQLGDLPHNVVEHQRIDPLAAAGEQVGAELGDDSLGAHQADSRRGACGIRAASRIITLCRSR